MLFKSYLKSLLLVSVIMIVVIAITNFIVDPGNIYQKHIFQNKGQTPKDFVNLLVDSNYGVFRPENVFNERDIVSELAIHPADYECVIIGSSRVKQISTARKNKSLSKFCGSIKNLGVSGGSLEDYLAISNIVLNNKVAIPKKFFIGIDPWSLNFGRDKKYVQYKQDFLSMITRINSSVYIEKNHDENETMSLFLNLFNLEYFQRSLDMIFNPNSLVEITQAPKFDFNKGLFYPVVLPDGSLVYSAKFIKDALKEIDKVDGITNYKIRQDLYYQDYAVDMFTKLVKYLQKNQIKVFFVMIPYHHSVIGYKDQPITKTLDNVSRKIHNLAKILQVSVIGSYNPNDLQCYQDEFYDEYHPKDSCLTKLDNKITPYKIK